MAFKILLAVTILLSSCASIEGRWGEWQRRGAPRDEMIWNFCSKDLHGEKLHAKGMCYPALFCRIKNRRILPDKEQCRTQILFCAWGDIDCMNEHNIFYADIIINK